MYKKRMFGILILIMGIMLVFAFLGCEGPVDPNDPDNPPADSITVRNNTGYTLDFAWIKPSTSPNWGSRYGFTLSDGESTTGLSSKLSVNGKYDIRLSQYLNGYVFTKYGVTISRNMTISFTTGDLDDGSNEPTITVGNWSGVTFNSVHIKPSSSSDWGTSMGSISNNNDEEITIPIPPSNYSVFDIQMRSSNPTNSYTRTNVSITDGMTFTFTSADRDNPSIELPVIVLKNNTGYSLMSYWIRPSTSTDWGSENWVWLDDEELITAGLPQSLSANNAYDIRLTQNQFGGGYNFIKNDVVVSEGMIVTFTSADLEQ